MEKNTLATISQVMVRIFAEHSADYTSGASTLEQVIDSCNLTAYVPDTDCLGKRIDEMHALAEDFDSKLLAEARRILIDYIVV